MNRKQRREADSRSRSGASASYIEALRFYAARQLNEAEACLRQVLRRNPSHADSLHLLGLIAHLSGRYEMATDLIGQAVALNEKEPNFRNNLGLALLKTGANEAAVRELAQGLALAPDHADIRANLAKALHANGDVADALRQYEKALAMKPSLVTARCDFAVLLYAGGKVEEAIAQYEKALETDPTFALARHNLGRLLYERGDVTAAERHLRRYLERDPADRHGARLLLAAMGKEELPAKASETYLRDLYASRATRWDGMTAYYAHRLVADALEKHSDQASLDIVDAGCGTGLVGLLVKRIARRLDGVDLSTEMLAAAAAKGVYDRLYHDELSAWLGNAAGRYDAIVSAATLIHFGDLGPVLTAAAVALRPGGLLVFSAFPPHDPALDNEVVAGTNELALGGCFLHGRSHIRNRASEAGFTVEMLADEIHEHSDGKALPGVIVVLRRGRTMDVHPHNNQA